MCCVGRKKVPIYVFRTKIRHNSCKNCRKIVIIELELDIHTNHTWLQSEYSLTGYHLEIKYLTNTKNKRDHNSGKNCRTKFVVFELDLDTPKIHLLL